MRFNVCYSRNPLIASKAVPVHCDQDCLLGSIDWDICVTANKRLLLIFLTAVRFPSMFGRLKSWLSQMLIQCLHTPTSPSLIGISWIKYFSGTCQEDKAGSSACPLLSPVTSQPNRRACLKMQTSRSASGSLLSTQFCEYSYEKWSWSSSDSPHSVCVDSGP